MPIDGRTPLQAASGTGHGKGRAGPLWGQAASRSGTWAHMRRARTQDGRARCLSPDVVQQIVSGGPSVILVMEATEDRSTNDVPWRNTADGRKPTRAEWGLHAKTTVRPAVVIANILVQDARGVNLVEDDHMVEAIAAQSSVQTLANGVGLRRSWWSDQATCPAALHSPTEIATIDGIPVADQESRIHVVPIGDGFDKTLPRKLRARRWCNSDVDDLSSGQVHDDEAVQDLEAQGDYCKEIARPGLMEMVANKRGPALATVARQVRWSVLGDGPR